MSCAPRSGQGLEGSDIGVHSREASFRLGGQEIRGGEEEEPRQRSWGQGATHISSPSVLESAWQDRCC